MCLCQGHAEVGGICSFCSKWAGTPIVRRPKPFLDNSCLPECHYLSYKQTPKERRDIDDWQPRVQLRKQRASGNLILSNPDGVAAFADKFIVKSKFVVDYLQHREVIEFKKMKRMEEKARESRKVKEKAYKDYHWADLCEDVNMLKKLRVPE